MYRRWVIGMVAAIAALGLAGVGFSAFTANATVNGQATAGQVALKITDYALYGCYYVTGAPAPGGFYNIHENAAETVMSFQVQNLTPAATCEIKVFIQNSGTVPINVSDQLNETAGICGLGGTNCYNVGDQYGLSAVGGVTTATVTPPLIPPGVVFSDLIQVAIPAGSTSVPPVGVFAIEYTAVVGI